MKQSKILEYIKKYNLDKNEYKNLLINCLDTNDLATMSDDNPWKKYEGLSVEDFVVENFKSIKEEAPIFSDTISKMVIEICFIKLFNKELKRDYWFCVYFFGEGEDENPKYMVGGEPEKETPTNSKLKENGWDEFPEDIRKFWSIHGIFVTDLVGYQKDFDLSNLSQLYIEHQEAGNLPHYVTLTKTNDYMSDDVCINMEHPNNYNSQIESWEEDEEECRIFAQEYLRKGIILLNNSCIVKSYKGLPQYFNMPHWEASYFYNSFWDMLMGEIEVELKASDNLKDILKLLYEWKEAGEIDLPDMKLSDSFGAYNYLNEWFGFNFKSNYKDRFLQFGCMSPGALALWFYPELKEEPPVVYLGDESKVEILASSLEDFASLLTQGKSLDLENYNENRTPKDIWKNQDTSTTQFKKLVSEKITCRDENSIFEAINKHPNFIEWVDKIRDKHKDEILTINDYSSLSLDGKALTEVPKSVLYNLEVTKLDLSDNKITELPEFLGQLTKLETIYLEDNQITEIPKFFENFEHLRDLILSNNNLTELKLDFTKMKSLEFLYVEGNSNFSHIDESIYQSSLLYFFDYRETLLAKKLSRLEFIEKSVSENMPIKQLEHSNAIYQESLKLRERFFSAHNNDDTQIIKKEEEHQALILELSENSVLLFDIDELIQHEDKDIRREAYLVALETKDSEIAKKVIQSYYKIVQKRDGSSTPLPLSFLTEEAFDIFMEAFISIRKAHKDKYIALHPIIDYLAANQHEKYLDFFMDLDFFTLDEQKDILDGLGHLEKFSSVIKEKYYNKHPFFEVSFFEDSTNCRTTIPLLLAREEERGLILLRDNKYIEHEYALRPFIHYFGDKDDVKFIIDFFASDKSKKDPEVLANRIKSLTAGGGNYAYVETFFEMLEIDVLVTLAICEQFIYYAKVKEEDEDYDTHWEILDALNSAAYLTDEEIDEELSEEEKRLINPSYIKKFWRGVFEKNKNLINPNERISLLDEGELYSLNTLLDNVLYYDRVIDNDEPLPAELKYLIIYTGKYLPLDEAGYYTKLKRHVTQWREYIEESKKDLEDGRWWRYGRYVD